MRRFPLESRNLIQHFTSVEYRKKFGMLRFSGNPTKNGFIIDNLYGYELTEKKKDEFVEFLISKKFAITEKRWNGDTLTITDNRKNTLQIRFQISTESKTNWGNTVESILTVAIGCRFKHKIDNITQKQYYDFLNEFNKKSKLETTSDNKDISDKDNLTVTLSLTKSDSLFIRTDETKYKTYVNSALQYVNTSKVKAWSKLIYENNRIDEITVTGKGKQGGKVDTEVRCTGQDPNANLKIKLDLSVKAESVKQFGQAVGSDFDTTNNFLNDIFGYQFKSDKLKYDNLISKHKVAEAFQLAYQKIAQEINQNGVDPDILVKGIKQHATGGNSQMRMLILGQDAKLLNFEKLQQWVNNNKSTWDIVNEQFYADYQLTNSYFPKIQIKIKGYDNTKSLFQVRARQDKSTSKGNIVYRHYIEKGTLMNELLGVDLQEE
jgi:hypothetical protein